LSNFVPQLRHFFTNMGGSGRDHRALVCENLTPGKRFGRTIPTVFEVKKEFSGLTKKEVGLAYHLQSFRGDEEKQILLDFALTPRTLTNNYQGLRVDPAKADALIISHGHVDHYGGLLDVARSLQGRAEPGLTLYAGGRDTFCHRWVVQPDGKKLDYGELKRDELEGRGLNIVLAEEPTTVAGHAITSGRVP
jgi:metal-dependent hydrolase (beta-lactamase superfamily II)